MPLLPVVAALAVVVAMLAAIGSRSNPNNAQTGGPRTSTPVVEVAAPPAAAPPATAAAMTPPPSASAGTVTGQLAAKAFSADQKTSIEQIVREYLLNHPEVLAEATALYEQKQETARAEAMKKAVSDLAPTLFRSPTAPIAGNAKGDVTVVEFFDYNCGYCKRAIGDVARLIDGDKKVKVVFKELPIFGKESEAAARVAIAARKQNKYWEVHRGLMDRKGKADEAAALEIAQAAGVNLDQLRKDMASAEVKKEMDETKGLAEKMGIQGTPHFFVADRVIPGAPDDLYDVMVKHVAEVRKAGGCAKFC